MDTNFTNVVSALSLAGLQALSSSLPSGVLNTEKVLSQKEISLDKRYNVSSVNDVFKDNILLNIAYLKGVVKDPAKIDWEEVQKPFKYEFKLKPGETFAFHDDVLPEYTGKIAKTTNAHFNAIEGFKTDGYLFGDGVCHLASILYWAAKDAGVEANAPVAHDFMVIPEIPKEYGVSIFSNNTAQNLYIKNNKNKDLSFRFEYQNNDLRVLIVESLI